MKKETLTLQFEITSYNLLTENDLAPTDLKIKYKQLVNKDDNFLEVVEDIVKNFQLNKRLKKLNYSLEDIYKILWSEYFSDEFLDRMLRKVDKNDYSKLDVTIRELDEQFSLANKVIKITIPSGEYNHEIKFFFHVNKNKKHLIPHIHCEYCGIERKIDLKRIEFLENPFISKRVSMEVLGIVYKYQNEFINYWEKVVNSGEAIQFDMII